MRFKFGPGRLRKVLLAVEVGRQKTGVPVFSVVKPLIIITSPVMLPRGRGFTRLIADYNKNFFYPNIKYSQKICVL